MRSPPPGRRAAAPWTAPSVRSRSAPWATPARGGTGRGTSSLTPSSTPPSLAGAMLTRAWGSPATPAPPGAYDTTHNGGRDVFVAKLGASGSALLYATFLGGSSGDYGYGIAVDA